MTDKLLRDIKPNAGISARYQKQLTTLVDELEASVLYWTRAAYRANPTGLAQDASASVEIQAALTRLRRRWLKRFDALAKDMAGRFVRDAMGRFDRAFMDELRKAGFTVRFKMTPAVNNLVQASVAENVTLIKSIPAQHLDRVEGAVMRSVTAGRDLKTLTDELEKVGGITRRRAANIAIDQNNKATGAITRARRIELGLTKAVWRHSKAGRHPRPTHVAMDGEEFDISKGMYDKAVQQWIQPGELPYCRCTSRVKLPDFTNIP